MTDISLISLRRRHMLMYLPTRYKWAAMSEIAAAYYKTRLAGRSTLNTEHVNREGGGT